MSTFFPSPNLKVQFVMLIKNLDVAMPSMLTWNEMNIWDSYSGCTSITDYAKTKLTGKRWRQDFCHSGLCLCLKQRPDKFITINIEIGINLISEPEEGCGVALPFLQLHFHITVYSQHTQYNWSHQDQRYRGHMKGKIMLQIFWSSFAAYTVKTVSMTTEEKGSQSVQH